MSKKFIYKIYTNSGTFLRILPIRLPTFPSVDDELVLNTPRITSSINQGQGQLMINFDAKFDDFDEGNSIALDNIVELYLYDENHKDGLLLYTGVMVTYEPFIESTLEGVRIICVGRSSELNTDFFKSGVSFTVSINDKASEMFKDVIDHFRTIYTNTSINYLTASETGNTVSGSKEVSSVTNITNLRIGMNVSGTGISANTNIISIDEDSSTFTMDQAATATGSTVALTFTTINDSATTLDNDFAKKKWLQAVKDSHALAPGEWWWRIDPDGTALLKPMPAASTHTFNMGVNVDKITVNKSMESVINRVTVESSAPASPHQSDDAVSQAAYGIRSKYITDTGIQDNTTAQERADSEVASLKDLKRRVTIIINTQYDIETIRPGDTCRIWGEKVGSDVLIDNMQIVKVQYDGTRATLILEEDFLNLPKQLRSFNNQEA